MKNKYLLCAMAAVMAACSPQVFTMSVDMRHPSSSGLDLSGKSIAVAYLDDLSGRDTVFSAYMANGFAQQLEKDYFGGNTVIDVYRLEKDMGGDYAARDTLLNFLMDSGDDVVFLFDSPEFGAVSAAERQPVSGDGQADRMVNMTVPYTLRLYAYDSMDKDSVRVYKGTSNIRQPVFCNQADTDEDVMDKLWGVLDKQGEKAGNRSASIFMSTWKTETLPLVYFESSPWYEASQAASEHKWHDAMEKWMTLMKTDNMSKRSSAEYDMAVACYLLGEYDLAIKWLDRSDKDYKMSFSGSLRNKILARKKK